MEVFYSYLLSLPALYNIMRTTGITRTWNNTLKYNDHNSIRDQNNADYDDNNNNTAPTSASIQQKTSIRKPFALSTQPFTKAPFSKKDISSVIHIEVSLSSNMKGK